MGSLKKRALVYITTILVFGLLVYFVYDHFRDVKKKDLQEDYFLNTEIDRNFFGTNIFNKRVYIVIGQNKYLLNFENSQIANEFTTSNDYSVTMSFNDSNQLSGYFNNPIISTSTYRDGTFYKGDVLIEDSNKLIILFEDMVTDEYYSKIGYIDGLIDIPRENIDLSFAIE